MITDEAQFGISPINAEIIGPNSFEFDMKLDKVSSPIKLMIIFTIKLNINI